MEEERGNISNFFKELFYKGKLIKDEERTF